MATHEVKTLCEHVVSPSVDLVAVEEFIRRVPSSVNTLHPTLGQTPLQLAARRGHSQLIRLLITHGANLEARTESGETPFLIACYGGNLYAVHTLVDSGVAVNVTDNSGKTAMHLAAQVGAVHIIHYLSVTQGLRFQSPDEDGNTPLHLAVLNRNLETVKYLLKHHRSDIQATNKHGTTPVHFAASLGSIVLCWLLVSNSSDKILTAEDNNGYTPVERACMGQTARHASLGRHLKSWSDSALQFYTKFYYYLFFVLPGLSLLLAMIAFCHVEQPFGAILALPLVIAGFFYPMSYHRTPHVSALPSPALYGALISGLIHTAVCYFTVVLPRLWPDNMLWFFISICNAVTGIYLLVKLKMADPGFDKVGKIGADGNPLTIVDVARQGDQDPKSSVPCSFCPTCEIVIPMRTKHCKLCQGCCNGFDHHCMWVDSCIGYKNHRIFILFALFLWTENFLFVREALACISNLFGFHNPLLLAKQAFYSEPWILFLIICNVLTGLYVFMNFAEQVRHVSKQETIYFDMAGRPAYGKKRDKLQLSIGERMKLLYLFFANYQKWLHVSYRDHVDNPKGSFAA